MIAAGSGSTALLTDRYELTMVAAAVADGTASRACVFEVFARRLPDGRRYGVVAGTGRLLESISRFRFGDEEIAALDGIVDHGTLDWLAGYRFTGTDRHDRDALGGTTRLNGAVGSIGLQIGGGS